MHLGLFIVSFEPGKYYCWLQQDKATAHTTGLTMQFLNEFFGDLIISRPLWPLHNCNLTPQIFIYEAMSKTEFFKTSLIQF